MKKLKRKATTKGKFRLWFVDANAEGELGIRIAKARVIRYDLNHTYISVTLDGTDVILCGCAIMCGEVLRKNGLFSSHKKAMKFVRKIEKSRKVTEATA